MSFALGIRKYAERAERGLHDTVAEIVFSIAAELDNRSPVGDATYWKNPPPKGYVGGRFRANWQLGVDTIPTGELDLVDTSPKGDEGGTTTARIAASIPEEAGGRVYYLVNNLPYAQRLENGYSRQAPAGVVGLTVTRFSQIVREASDKIK